jgi:hypothetical protein
MEPFHPLFGLRFCVEQNHSIYYLVQELVLLNGHHCLFIHLMDVIVDHWSLMDMLGQMASSGEHPLAQERCGSTYFFGAEPTRTLLESSNFGIVLLRLRSNQTFTC